MWKRLAVVAVLVGISLPAASQDVPQGLTEPVVLPPFDPAVASCDPPAGLVRTLAFAQDNEREFVTGIAYGLSRAAEDRGLDYVVALAGNDPRRQVEQVAGLIEGKVGSVVVSPVDPPTLAPHLQHLLATGAWVGAIVPPPASTILNAPQYETGRILAEAAAQHIRTVLGGRARVVLLTQDSIEFLAPRFAAMRDVLGGIDGVEIVADLSPRSVDRAGGRSTMATILSVQPRVDVVLGADTVVLGALDALRDAGRLAPGQFLGGIDGEPDAVAQIRAGGPFKVSVSLNSPVFGYALGQFAADWLDGRPVPQGLDILPRALSAETLDAYAADLADPAAVWADPQRRASYLAMYGSICATSYASYLNFPWSSEQRQ